MFSQDKCEESTNHYINLGFLIQRRLGLYHRCFIVIDCLQLTAEKLHPNFLLRRKKTVAENLTNEKKIVRWVRKFLSDHWWDRLCGSTTTAAKCEEWKLYLKRLDDNLWHPVVFYSPTETQHLVKLRHLTLRNVYDSDAVLGHSFTRPPDWLRGSAALQQTNTSSASALRADSLYSLSFWFVFRCPPRWSDSSAAHEMQLLHEFVISHRAAKNPKSWHETRRASQYVSYG